MARSEYGSRVVVGVISSRSSDVAAIAADLTYSVEIDDDGVIMIYDGVKPGNGWRPTDTDGVDPETLYLPFMIGQRVPIGIEPTGSVDTINILAREHMNLLPCEDDGAQP